MVPGLWSIPATDYGSDPEELAKLDGELPGTLRGVPNGAHSCTNDAVSPLEIEEYIANHHHSRMTVCDTKINHGGSINIYWRT